MFFWVTYLKSSACPSCEHVIERTVLSSRAGLGPSIVSCPKCGQQIETGNVEWEEMEPGRRFGFWFRQLFWGSCAALIGSFTVCVALAQLVRWGLQERGILAKGEQIWLNQWFLILGSPPLLAMMRPSP